MPSEGLATFLAGSQVYVIAPTDKNDEIESIATYVDRDLLQSGWLLGEAMIAKKAAAVSVQIGAGTVVLIGFRAQHRSQTHGTFKLVFNALLNRPASTISQERDSCYALKTAGRVYRLTRDAANIDPDGSPHRLGQ